MCPSSTPRVWLDWQPHRAPSWKRCSSTRCAGSSRGCTHRAATIGGGWMPPELHLMRSLRLTDFVPAFRLSTKADFLADQTEHPPFGERLGIPREEVALVNMTGGTSGQGQEIYGRVSARHSHAGLSACVALVLGRAKAGRHCHQLRSRRRSDHRRMGSGRRSAYRRRDRVSCRRHVVDRCKDRSDAARRRGEFHLRLDQLSPHAD